LRKKEEPAKQYILHRKKRRRDKIGSKRTTTQSERKSEFPETICRRGEKVQYKAAQTKGKKTMNPVRTGSSILQG
jgi:hypothetical protein